MKPAASPPYSKTRTPLIEQQGRLRGRSVAGTGAPGAGVLDEPRDRLANHLARDPRCKQVRDLRIGPASADDPAIMAREEVLPVERR
jgi:hypothetical protein